MENLKIFHVYRQRRDGSYYHVTSVWAESLKDAIKRAHDGAQHKYRVLGIQIDTGQPYDDRNFPFHIYKRIENKGAKVQDKGYMYGWYGNKKLPE